MKKSYLITLVAALTLVGCSKNKHDEVTGPDAWKYDDMLPVPIMFRAPETGPATKAIIDDFTELNANGMIGVFGLDLDQTGSTWNSTQEYPTLTSVLLNNQAAKVNSTDGSMTFVKGNSEVNRYYPLSGQQTFDFYAYYPYVEPGGSDFLSCFQSPTPENRHGYVATYSIGDTDIMWAKAESKSFQLGNNTYHSYNAAYMRKLTEYAAGNDALYKSYLPKFEFEHKLTALEFKLVSTVEAANNLDKANAVITGLSINNTCTQAALVIAHKSDDSKSGEIEPLKTGTVKMKGEGGSTTFAVKMSSGLTDADGDRVPDQDSEGNPTKTVNFGNGLLLMPQPASGKFTGKLHFSLSGVEQVVEFELKDPQYPNRNFTAGTKYTYTIVVKDPQTIIAYAELIPWENGNVMNPIDPMN